VLVQIQVHWLPDTRVFEKDAYPISRVNVSEVDAPSTVLPPAAKTPVEKHLTINYSSRTSQIEEQIFLYSMIPEEKEMSSI
jgi:hypothetical protein